MKYNTNKLMIVAHADDEVIWAGEKLLKEKGQWDILCVVLPDSQSKFRIPMFLEKVSCYLEANTEMLQDFEDPGFYNPLPLEILKPIQSKIKEKEWDQILTHGKSGEYGHIHHKQVHEVVVGLANDLDILDRLWVFDPIKNAPIESLTKEKADIFSNTYDDETLLPSDHPTKWIHGWNTTQGWVENIKKWKQ
jgi:LmbE family N-acetylglucosaminyl deacetylase|tara:strand:+ start:323 stop:898 length:576 start_codon:yes stop_codon:yes gene_type:complete